MKKLFIMLACLACLQSKSQQLVNPFPKTISVNGKPNDLSVYYYPGNNYFRKDMLSNTVMTQEAAPQNESTIDFRKIKLKFDVNVVFAIR